MPDEIVADDKHVILFAEFDIYIGQGKIIGVRLGMDDLPLQDVFGADGIELRLDDRSFELIPARKLGGVQRSANEKTSLIGVFESGRVLPVSVAGQSERHSKQQKGFGHSAS